MQEKSRLIVALPFDDYRRGDEITREEDIENAIKNHKEKIHLISAFTSKKEVANKTKKSEPLPELKFNQTGVDPWVSSFKQEQ